MSSETETKTFKKLPRGSVKLQFAGDLILARCEQTELAGLFRRFESLFEALANVEKKQRILCYKLLNTLMLTSYAKKAPSIEEKRSLFEKKNELFLSVARSPDYKKLIKLKYLVSKNFRVTKYCDNCTKANQENEFPKHQWKHCKDCSLDRNFYNIVSMSHNFTDGYASVFLSNDQLPNLPFGKPKIKGKLADAKEEAQYGKYQYNSKNLDAIDYDSVMKMYDKFKDK